MIPSDEQLKELISKIENKETVLWSGNSQGGNVIELNVSEYKKLKVKVRLSGLITFLEIDLTKETGSIFKNDINYKYGNAVTAGALDGTQYVNKCSVAVSEDKTKVIGYDFGYANLSTSWNFQNRDGTSGWAILEIVGIK